jgi:creatinine amidohydrolase
MTSPEVEEYLKEDDRIIIPVGSVEQHGNFAALGTDSYVSQCLAEDGSKRTGVMIASPLWYGWAPHHLVRKGTVSIRPEILIELLIDILSSLSKHGFKNFVIINGHRIVNIPWMQIAAQKAQADLGVKIMIFDPAYMSKELTREDPDFNQVGHADEIEISQMIYKYPDLVQLDKASDNPSVDDYLYHVDPASLLDTLCYVPSTAGHQTETLKKTGDTITGRPTEATAEKGRKYHEYLVKHLVEVLEKIK